MQIIIDIPIPSRGQNIINIPIHYCGGQVVDAGGYGFEERNTGKWIGAENKCSCCNRAIWEYRTLPFDWRPRYCPNCGAKMEAGK